MSFVEVVSACIVRDGRLLLTQRRADKDFAFTWESPGGKVDALETHHDALKRELLEEIGIHVMSIEPRPFWARSFENLVKRLDRSHIRLFFYKIRAFTSVVTPLEGQGIGWFTSEEAARLTLAPGNAAAIDALVEQARGEPTSELGVLR